MGEEDDMKRRHHTPEQIVRNLRESDRTIGEGTGTSSFKMMVPL